MRPLTTESPRATTQALADFAAAEGMALDPAVPADSGQSGAKRMGRQGQSASG